MFSAARSPTAVVDRPSASTPDHPSIPHSAIGFDLLAAPLYTMFSATALFSTVVEAAALHCSAFCCAPSPSLSSALTAVMRLRFSPNANSENPVYPKKAACTDVVAQAARRTRCFDHKNRAAPRRFVLLSELLQLHMHIHTNLLRRKGVRHTAVVSVYINEMGVIFGIYK